MRADEPPLAPFLRRLCLHSALTAMDQQAILNLPSQTRRFRANEELTRQEGLSRHACFVGEGVIGRFDQTLDGKRQITAFHFPGEAANLRSVVLSSYSSASETLSSGIVHCVPHAAIRNVALTIPAIARAFWRECAVDAAIMSEWMLNIGRRAGATRIAHLICEMAVRLGLAPMSGQVSFPLPVTQFHLADASALTPIHVNRVLQELRRKGVAFIGGRGKSRGVVIPSWQPFADYAEFDPAYLCSDGRSDARVHVADAGLGHARPTQKASAGSHLRTRTPAAPA